MGRLYILTSVFSPAYRRTLEVSVTDVMWWTLVSQTLLFGIPTIYPGKGVKVKGGFYSVLIWPLDWSDHWTKTTFLPGQLFDQNDCFMINCNKTLHCHLYTCIQKNWTIIICLFIEFWIEIDIWQCIIGISKTQTWAWYCCFLTTIIWVVDLIMNN